MKVAVITPYHDIHSPYLKPCLDSVQQQDYSDFFHVTVGDGCDLREIYPDAHVCNIALPARTNDYGDSPRSVGVVYAFSQGADAVMFLDSDNWYAANHISHMTQHQVRTGADVITCRRILTQLDGAKLGICPASDGVVFCDTNCMLIAKSLAEEAGLWWLIPPELHAIDDRVMWDTIVHATQNIYSSNKATVYYRTAYAFHYDMFKARRPEGVKSGTAIAALGNTIDQLQARAEERARQRPRL